MTSKIVVNTIEADVGINTVNFVGDISASNFTGNLDASLLSTGTIPDARFPAILPAISGENLTNLSSVAGIGLTYGRRDTIFTHTSGSTESYAQLFVEITPQSTDSLIEVSSNVSWVGVNGSTSDDIMMSIILTADVGDGNGNLVQHYAQGGIGPASFASGTRHVTGTIPLYFIDSPNTTGIVTYRIFSQAQNTTSTHYVHARWNLATNAQVNLPSFLVAREIQVI